jgi:hypothetical protein
MPLVAGHRRLEGAQGERSHHRWHRENTLDVNTMTSSRPSAVLMRFDELKVEDARRWRFISELPMVEPTRGTGSPRRWQPRTPAMAAGLTDHVWTTNEWLSYRVPAPFVDRLDQLEHLFPQPEPIYQGN